MLSLVLLAYYLLWERPAKRKRNAVNRPVFGPSMPLPKEDIIGKSKFDLRHSLPEATTLIKSDKPAENASIFAAGNEKPAGQSPPATIPPSQLDRVFSSAQAADDPSEIDLVVDNEPDEESEPEDDEGMVDTEESGQARGSFGVSVATGVDFEDLSGMVKTVENPEAATTDEKEEAGRVLTEIRMTDMFEQVVSSEAGKKVTAGKLMDDYFAAYLRRKREAGEATDEPTVKAPKDFNVRAFA